jgi:hypothetical protein
MNQKKSLEECPFAPEGEPDKPVLAPVYIEISIADVPYANYYRADGSPVGSIVQMLESLIALMRAGGQDKIDQHIKVNETGNPFIMKRH